MQAGELVRVALEVVELALAVRVLDVDVAVGADRVEGGLVDAGCALDQQIAAPFEAAVLEQREERTAVLRLPRLGAGGLEDRRGEVGVGHELAAARALRHARAAHDQRYADRGLVDEHLADLHAVLAVEEAVVRREQDQRVVELALGAQGVDDPHDGLVDGEQRLEPLLVVLVDRGRTRGVDRRQRLDEARLVGQVALVVGGVRRQPLAREAVDVPRRRRGRDEPGRVVRVGRAAAVGREECEREEERRARVAHPPDDRQGALGVVVGRVVDRVAVEPVLVEQPVLVQRVAVEEVRRRVDRRVPLAPAERHLRGVADPVLVQELADVHGPVARPLEPDRQPVALVEPAVAAVRGHVADHAVVVRVLPGEQRRARGTAERVRHEGAFEGGSLRGQ